MLTEYDYTLSTDLLRQADGSLVWKVYPKAYLQYRVEFNSSGKIFDVKHVFVPKKLRGHGIAEILCLIAIQVAHKENMLVRPTCTYVRDTFIPRHNDLLMHFSINEDTTDQKHFKRQKINTSY